MTDNEKQRDELCNKILNGDLTKGQRRALSDLVGTVAVFVDETWAGHLDTIQASYWRVTTGYYETFRDAR